MHSTAARRHLIATLNLNAACRQVSKCYIRVTNDPDQRSGKLGLAPFCVPGHWLAAQGNQQQLRCQNAATAPGMDTRPAKDRYPLSQFAKIRLSYDEAGHWTQFFRKRFC